MPVSGSQLYIRFVGGPKIRFSNLIIEAHVGAREIVGGRGES